MAVMLGNLYSALREANVGEQSAQKAAKEVAGFEQRLTRMEANIETLKWMVGFTLSLTIMILAGMLGIFWRLVPMN